MAGNHNSGPRRQMLPGFMPGGIGPDGKPVNPLIDAVRFEDLQPPLDKLNAEGLRFWRAVAKRLCDVGEMCEVHTFALDSLAYQHQCLVKKERGGFHVSAQERAAFNRMLTQFGLGDDRRLRR